MDSRTADDERLGTLMQAAQAGDTEAYLRLLQDITPRVRQMIARRHGGRTVDDEDLVQDVLLSIHVARASYDPGRPFLPWLLAIVHHRVVDGRRRFARVSAHEIPVEHVEVTFSQPETKSIMEISDEAIDLRRAVSSLPARQRKAIELLKLQEMSLKEAAAATGTSEGALKVATHRAMVVLRRMLIRGGTDGH